MKRYIVIFSYLLVACSTPSRETAEHPPPHGLWDQLLKAHVTEEGMVDYKGIIADREKLETYLHLLSTHAPDRERWSREERLAYWINAYNAFTIKLIIDHYPLKSIQDLNPSLYIPGINTVWHKEFFEIGGVKTSLDEIEHGILRKQFEEPRIHFAINCASISCPPLRREAYSAAILDQQLEHQARRFINDPSRNKISQDLIQVSPIFSWFLNDFTTEGDLRTFLNRYSDVPVSKRTKIEYLKYNWELNDTGK